MGTAKSVGWQHQDEQEALADAYWSRRREQLLAGCATPTAPGAPAARGGVEMSATPATPHARAPASGVLAAARGGGAQPAASARGTAYAAPALLAQERGRQRYSGQVPVTAPLQETTLILWDWDDTLMCSSAINANQLQAHQAAQLEALLEQVLTTSMRLGETCIITNADELWVMESTRRFAPRVLPLLSQLSVVSARRKYEHSIPGDVFAWKRETFCEVLAARGVSQGGRSLNLVVLGDSPAEMEAAQTCTVGLPFPILVKTVKFKETPSVEELLEQLRIVSQDLSWIVADNKSTCRNLTQWMRPQPQLVLPAAPYASAHTVLASTIAYAPPLVAAAPYPAAVGAYANAPMVYAAGYC